MAVVLYMQYLNIIEKHLDVPKMSLDMYFTKYENLSDSNAEVNLKCMKQS